MGITTALNTTVGSNPSLQFKMMSKLLVVACAAVAVSAEADAGYLGYAPALLNAYPNWPGVSTPYSQSTCYGCRPYYGKRSADAEAEADPALLYGAYGYAGVPYAYGAYPYACGLTAAYGLAGEVAAPTASGYLNLYGKRSADAEADPALLYGAYGYAAPYAYGAYPYGYRYGLAGVAAHPGAATSFVARSPQGLGKRSADADPALLLGTYGYGPYVTGNTYGYGPSGYGISQGHPGAASSFQSVTRLH